MAKTAAQYKDEYINNNKKATQSAITEAQTANTNISNQYVKDMNAVIDQSVSNSVNKVQGEIDKLPTAYQSAFDANAVQQKINERQTKARMSDLGLTDSGLNRTQQTAIAIQRSNADAATRQQMNAASFSLKQQIADLRASGEGQKAEIAAKAKSDLAQQNQSVYSTLMGNLYSDANTYANNQIDADAKKYAADQQLASDTIKYANDQAKWYAQNGYTQDKNGNWVYTGKHFNTKTFDTEEEYDFAYEKIAEALAYGEDSPQFQAVMNSLQAQGYDVFALEGVVSDVVMSQGKTPEKTSTEE